MTEQSWRRITGWAAVLVGVLALLLLIERLGWIVQPILNALPPFLIALALACMLDPTIDRLQRRGVPRGRAVVLIGLLFLVVFVGLAFFLVPRIAEQAGNLAGNLPAYYKQAGERLDGFMAKERPILHRLNLPTSVAEASSRFSDQIRSASAAALDAASGFVLAILSKALWLIIIPLVTLYLLVDIDRLRRKTTYLVPERYRPRFLEVTGAIGTVFSAYIRGVVVVSALYACVSVIVLGLIFHVNYALVLGMVAGLLYIVPYIGPVATVLITAFVAYAQEPSIGRVAVIAVVQILQNVTFDQGIYPRVVGGAVGLHPVVSIFALMVGGSMFGVAGMILAVPVAASIQIILVRLFPRLGEPVPEGKGVLPEPEGELGDVIVEGESTPAMESPGD